MTEDEREDEVHDSTRLGDNLRADGIRKPNSYYHAHAIISGNHERAWRLRTILAELEIGVDDSHNGCWLPQSSKYLGQAPYPKAVPHSRIHRANYYMWLSTRFALVSDRDKMVNLLRMTRVNLLNSSFPPEVMLKKGEWERPYDNL